MDVERAIEHLLQLHARAEARMEQTDRRMEQIDRRMEQIDVRMEQIDVRMGQIDVRIEQVERRMDQVDTRLDKVDKRMDKMEKQIYATRDLVRAGMKLVIQMGAKQKETDRKLDAVIVRLEELTEAQQRTDAAINKLVQAQQKTETNVQRILKLLAGRSRNGRSPN